MCHLAANRQTKSGFSGKGTFRIQKFMSPGLFRGLSLDKILRGGHNRNTENSRRHLADTAGNTGAIRATSRTASSTAQHQKIYEIEEWDENGDVERRGGEPRPFVRRG